MTPARIKAELSEFLRHGLEECGLPTLLVCIVCQCLQIICRINHFPSTPTTQPIFWAMMWTYIDTFHTVFLSDCKEFFGFLRQRRFQIPVHAPLVGYRSPPFPKLGTPPFPRITRCAAAKHSAQSKVVSCGFRRLGGVCPHTFILLVKKFFIEQLPAQWPNGKAPLSGLAS